MKRRGRKGRREEWRKERKGQTRHSELRRRANHIPLVHVRSDGKARKCDEKGRKTLKKQNKNIVKQDKYIVKQCKNSENSAKTVENNVKTVTHITLALDIPWRATCREEKPRVILLRVRRRPCTRRRLDARPMHCHEHRALLAAASRRRNTRHR